MKKTDTTPPSIFNDVIGPVMRGPSSSHCAAALRIGRIARDVMSGDINEVELMFDTAGSLATTHQTQGSDMGFFGGLLGMDVTDERLQDSVRLIAEKGIKVTIDIKAIHDSHPNTYNINLKNDRFTHSLKAISTGGGIIEITRLDEFDISIRGDYYESLIICEKSDNSISDYIRKQVTSEIMVVYDSDLLRLIQIKTISELREDLVNDIVKQYGQLIREIIKINPVLPILSYADMKIPFTTPSEMQTYKAPENLQLWELATEYESMRGNLSGEEVRNKMQDIITILQNAIKTGLGGTEYQDRILGFQSGKFAEKYQNEQLLDAGMLNRMIMYVTALMEVKSSMGIIVAAPTAGACGGLPGAIIGAGHHMGSSTDDMVKAMLSAGIIGVFIANGATFAAEVAGCQAETGAGASMAAAGLVQLAGGSVGQALSAASLALQNTFGMTCDPVANRVEAPCLGKNVMAAANALSCANMALSGFDALIPLDEVIEAMYQVGISLPHELRCTALGGLSVTKTAREIEEKLVKIKAGK